MLKSFPVFDRNNEFNSLQNITVKFNFIIRNTTIQPCLKECNYTMFTVGMPSAHEIYFLEVVSSQYLDK